MEARPHPRQTERLAALYAYEILDTDREKDFDDIAQLAAGICGTAIAVVNLIDADRQWFKAETGLGVRETPLATSICSHVILEEGFVEIEDTLNDPRMLDNPLCCGDPGLRFYAGALLTTEEGLPIGTLCVLDWQPKVLTPLQRDTLRVLARQVMAQLEMRKALKLSRILRLEVDHRVKNSLQSLLGLARLQAKAVRSEEAVAALASMQNRIAAIAMLHEQLYKSDAGPTVDLGSYVANLRDHLAKVAPDKVAVEAEADSVTMSSNQAASVGTLINEFAANSFKHAFPDGRPGVVRIEVKSQPDGKLRVKCSDNGVGLSEPVEPSSPGIGMKIAEAACQQLGCVLMFDTGRDGLAAHFEFAPERP